jgi:hypothetical protein
VDFPRRSPHGAVLVADRGRTPAGAACAVSFGATGWIGAVGVLPGARRGGLGGALTEAACAWLRERGAETVLLFATALGRPVYARLGFVEDGSATAWRGSAGVASSGVSLRSLREGDRHALRELDAASTGERRHAVLDALRPLGGVWAERSGAPVGWAATSPFGASASICAVDDDTGVALLAAAAGGPGAAALVVPDANAAAVEALRRWSFQATTSAVRMRLGPPVEWRPERQFGLFNLFWG